jgi:hypothetical protein
MSMSTFVDAIKAPDEKWKRMKSVYDACRANKIGLPKEVEDFFRGESPCDQGVIMDIRKHECCKPDMREMYDGFTIELAKLPKDTTHVRFTNSH